jgi:phosphoribosylamine--glycine ligase
MDGFCVLKYDGLAAGKGVFVCGSLSELDAAIQEIRAVYGEKVPLIVEQRLEGDEISIIGFTDGKSVKLLQASQDHKQLLDGDKGPNTGGMGAYSPVEGIDPVLMKKKFTCASSNPLYKVLMKSKWITKA